MSIPQLSESDLQLLGRYDTPTISNAIEIFKVLPQTSGYMDGRIRACFPELPPMVGYASTATLRTAAAPLAGADYAGLEEQVAKFEELPKPAVVVIQDIDSPPVAATFGEVMTTIYKGFGAAGLITSGAARDLDQVRALGFPCFSDGIICSHGYPHLVDLGVPVNIGGITVYPGDLIHGDANGVTRIPHEIASEVAHACEEFAAAEQVVLDYINGGNPTPAGLKEARGECVRMIKALGERVRAKMATTS